MTSQENSVEERVARGAAMLDEKFPDWWQTANTDTLSMESGQHCIVRQVWGAEYWRVNDAFILWMKIDRGLAQEFFVSLGFDVDRGVEDGLVAYALLDRAWKTAIEARRAEA